MKKLQQYIQSRKVVGLEKVSFDFKISQKDVTSRIEKLEKEGQLSGITDDKGNYIYVTPEEFEKLASYIQTAGRVNMQALQEKANEIVRLTPTEEDREKFKQQKMQLLSKVEQMMSTDEK